MSPQVISELTPAQKSQPWSLGDVVDFQLELEGMMNEPKMEAKNRRDLFHAWLDSRRGDNRTLGRALDKMLQRARVVMLAAGTAAGMSAAGGFLRYQNQIHVDYFMGWLVLLPLIITVILFGCGRLTGESGELGRGVLWVLDRIKQRVSGSAVIEWEAFAGALKRHGKRLSPLMLPPLLGLTQLFAWAFGLGALLCLFLLVEFSPPGFGFGWHSVRSGAENRHWWAEIVSWPWRLLVPDGCPSLDQVRASQFTGAGGLPDKAAAKAWWPFLAWSLAIYSVFIRAVLFLALSFLGRWRLAKLQFDFPAANALHRRLLGPDFVVTDYSPSGAPVGAGNATSHVHNARRWLVFAGEGVSPDDLPSRISAALGGSVDEVSRIELDDDGANTAAYARISAAKGGIAIVIAEDTDPIEGTFKTLASIARAYAGRGWCVLLEGGERRRELWQKFAAAHGLELDMVTLPPL